MNDDLLVKYLLQETTPAEIRTVEAWITAAPANHRYFEHFKLIWDKSRELAKQSTVDEEAAWQRFRQRVQQPAGTGKLITMKPRRRQWLIAASTIGVAALAALFYLLGDNAPTGNPVVLTASHNSQVDTLPDGSVITLNKHSSLSYAQAYNQKNRTVTLQGEAFFKVQPDKNKPFVVTVNGIRVTVTGTSFNIKALGGNTEVIVETGSVQVSNNKETIALTPKEKVTIVHPDSTLVTEKVTDQLYSYYRDKVFVCDNTPLWKLVQVLNEAYDAHIVIASTDIRQLPLTATYDNESLDRVLDLVAQSLNITVTHENNRIILK